MTATTFTSLGSSTPGGSSTTIVLTIGANVSIGDNVFVFGGANGLTTGANFTFSDSAGNSYLTDVQLAFTSRSGHAFGHTTATAAMTSGVGQITCTIPLGSGLAIAAWIETTPGVTLPLASGSMAPSDGASSATYTGSTASCGSRTPTSNPDLIFCGFSTPAASASLGTVTGFTQRYHLTTAATTEYTVYGITNLTTSNAASAPTLTLGGPNPGVGTQTVYKYQGSATSPSELALLGVG